METERRGEKHILQLNGNWNRRWELERCSFILNVPFVELSLAEHWALRLAHKKVMVAYIRAKLIDPKICSFEVKAKTLFLNFQWSQTVWLEQMSAACTTSAIHLVIIIVYSLTFLFQVKHEYLTTQCSLCIVCIVKFWTPTVRLSYLVSIFSLTRSTRGIHTRICCWISHILTKVVCKLFKMICLSITRWTHANSTVCVLVSAVCAQIPVILNSKSDTKNRLVTTHRHTDSGLSAQMKVKFATNVVDAGKKQAYEQR